MPGDSVTPPTTLVLVLGASEWPNAPNLPGLPLFAHSARGFIRYLLSEEGFGVSKNNLLDLFDSDQPPNGLDHAISTFLIRRQEELRTEGTPAKDLILFYVGHGGFTPGDKQYF